MAESPSAKPTESLAHDTNGTNRTETPGGTKTDGYAVNALLPSAQYNWLQWAQGKSIEWCRANAVRHFDNLFDACDGTAEGDVFYVSSSGRGRALAAHQNNTGATAVTKIATDGRVVVTVDDQVCRGEPNAYINATFSSTARWSYDAATEQGIDVQRISTDGVVVAFGNGLTGTPPSVVIVTTAGDDGGMAYEDADTGYCYAVCADSLAPGTPRVWWGTHAGGSDKIYKWTGGARTQMLTGLTDVKCMCATEDCLIFSSVDATNVSLHCYYKEAFTLAWSVASFVASVGARAQAVCSDGDLVFHLLDGSGGAAPSLRCVSLLDGSPGGAIWTVTGGTNHSYGSGLRVECDDRYVYARWRLGANDTVTVFDKQTGRIVWYYATASITDFCLDGRSLMWCAADGRVYYYSLNAQPGVWTRRSGYDATREPAHLLALPVGSR